MSRVSFKIKMYGEDVVYLLGGSLLRAGDRLGEAVEKMRGLI